MTWKIAEKIQILLEEDVCDLTMGNCCSKAFCLTSVVGKRSKVLILRFRSCHLLKRTVAES